MEKNKSEAPESRRAQSCGKEKVGEYTLTMSSDQAAEVTKALELLMRLKIDQPEQICWALMDGMYDRIGGDEFCRRRDRANYFLKMAFTALFLDEEDRAKDAEWHRIYDIYQVVRKAIHDAEHPETFGVDSYPLLASGLEPMPKISWREKERGDRHD